MIKVVSFKICPFVQRVTAALAAKNIPFSVDYISLDNPPAWFAEVSPNQQVPLLITEDKTVLFESDAIIEYIDEKYGALQPALSPEQRANDRAWSYQASKHYLVQCGAMTSATQAILDKRSANLGKAFARIEKVLNTEPYYRGKTLGNVDIAWLPLLHRAKIIKDRTAYDFLADYPKVAAWQAALLKTDLAKKSVAADFVDAFSAFYLSDNTYLGQGRNCDVMAVDCCTSETACG